MRCIWELGCEILPGKMHLLVHIGAPFGTIGYVIHDAIKSDPFATATVTRIAAKLDLCDDAVGDVHFRDYTGIGWSAAKTNSPLI